MPEPLFKPTKVRSFHIEPFGVDGIHIHVADTEDWIELTCRPEAIVERDREIERLQAENDLWRGIIPFIEKTRNKETRGWDVAAQTRIGSVLLVIWTKVKKAVAPTPNTPVSALEALPADKRVTPTGGTGDGKAGGDIPNLCYTCSRAVDCKYEREHTGSQDGPVTIGVVSCPLYVPKKRQEGR